VSTYVRPSTPIPVVSPARTNADSGLPADRVGVGRLHGVGNGNQQRSGLLGLASGLHSEPARVGRDEEVEREPLGTAAAEQDGVPPAASASTTCSSDQIGASSVWPR